MEDSNREQKKESVSAAFAETIAKSVQRGNIIANRIKQLKENLGKQAAVSTKTFVNSEAPLKIDAGDQSLLQKTRGLGRETVIESSDSGIVKKKAEAFIIDFKPESQQNAFDDSLLFTDQEFVPESAICLPSDQLENDFGKLVEFSKIKWKRIREIAANPLLCGFDKYADGSIENPDKALLVQGLLGDNWFLSALGAIFKHDYLWNRLIGKGSFEKYREYGLYIFRFCKDNKQYHVIIDDKIPVVERSTGEFVPVFGRCLNPNLYWVSLIEKAYAKLHYRYYALHNGSVEDALYDLTGLNPESIIIDSKFITKNTLQLYLDALKILTLSGACVLTSISTERVLYPEPDKSEIKKNAEILGLLTNLWYHLDDVRDISLDEAKPGILEKLTQISCLWGIAVSREKLWIGDFNNKDPRWTKKLKEEFNTFYLEQNNRYGEVLFTHDFSNKHMNGSFIMPINSCIERFNSIIILRDFPNQYNGIEYESCWFPSYGHPNIKSTNWINNPHYIFKIRREDSELTPLIIVLQQKDPRFMYNEPGAKFLSMGIVILSMNESEEDVKFYDVRRLVGFVKPTETRFVNWNGNLSNGKYCIIPVTRNDGDMGQHFLKIYYDCNKDEIGFGNAGFKTIMEKEGLNEGRVTSTTRVVDATLSSMMIKGFMGKSKLAKWAGKVLTPFSLDEIINPSIAEGMLHVKTARTKNKTSGKILREFNNDIQLRLYDAKLDKEQEYDFHSS